MFHNVLFSVNPCALISTRLQRLVAENSLQNTATSTTSSPVPALKSMCASVAIQVAYGS